MIELRGISKAYRVKGGWNRVFDGFDLDIGPNDRIGVLGRNGSGKSTLLRMICGAENPDRGTLTRGMSV